MSENKTSNPAVPPTTPVTRADVEAALVRIRGSFGPTLLTKSEAFSGVHDGEVYLKWDNRLVTGSFKERGAVNFLLKLDEAARKSGVCAASAGNHALALSYHAARLGIRCEIVMPTTAPLTKIERTEGFGAKVLLHGAYFDEAVARAQQLARDEHLTFVPAFDHADVIAGQGTVALEMEEQLSDFDSVIVPVGGGGYIGGIVAALKERRPDVYIVGAQSQWATEAQERRLTQPGVYQRLRPPSIADGIAVKTRGQLTSELMQNVDALVQVSERELARGVIHILERERVLIEGAAAAPVAALLRGSLPKRCRKTISIISGSNIDINMLVRIIQSDMAERGKFVRLVVSVADRPGSLHAITGILADAGANVLEVVHDRSFSRGAGYVGIMFVLEVRDRTHRQHVIEALEREGVPVTEF